MSQSSWLAGARALLRFTRGGGPASAPAQKREQPRTRSTGNTATASPLRSSRIDVGQEVRAVLGGVRPSRVRFEFAVQPELVLRADRAGFHQVLADLVKHACSQALVSRVLVTASRSGEWIQVGVSDDGVGVDRGSWQRALWPIERLITQQGGSLEVANWPDEGTTVLTRWPATGATRSGPGRVAFVARERAPTG